MKVQRTGENPRAIETQWIGVNLWIEVAHSRKPTSIETRGRTDNTQASNDEVRSLSGIVFKRLGRGEDIGETLNRRQE